MLHKANDLVVTFDQQTHIYHGLYCSILLYCVSVFWYNALRVKTPKARSTMQTITEKISDH
jgi:hypothetical protein